MFGSEPFAPSHGSLKVRRATPAHSTCSAANLSLLAGLLLVLDDVRACRGLLEGPAGGRDTGLADPPGAGVERPVAPGSRTSCTRRGRAGCPRRASFLGGLGGVGGLG